MDNPWANNELTKPIAKEGIKLQPYWRFLIGNLLFAGLVAFWCSFSVMLVFLGGLVVMVVLLPMALNARNESRELWRQRWVRFAIYTVAISVGGMIDHQASENEQRNFDNIIVAVDQYNATEKHYPHTLEQLVPKYLAAVPHGRWGKFTYYTTDPDDARLLHMSMPPVKETYNFKSKTRKTWD